MTEQALREAHALFRSFRDALFFQGFQVCLDGQGAFGQASVFGDLDIQARAGVELKNQRAFLFVEHHVHADIA